MAAPTLLWFRRDLRLHDNPALSRALELGAPICAIYVHAPEEESPWAPGAASRWWLHRSLLELSADLERRGLRLHCLRGSAISLLPEIARRIGAQNIIWNRLYEPQIQDRDRRLEALLREQACEVQAFDSGYFFSPGRVMTQQGTPYRVFSPYWRSLCRALHQAPPSAPPALPEGPWPDGWRADTCADPGDLGLLDEHPWHHKLGKHWKPGEAAALGRLADFLAQGIADYDVGRDRPDRDGTSHLSPHLHFGEISPNTVLSALGRMPEGSGKGAEERFLAELGWREFARDLLWHFPQTESAPLDRRYADDFWRPDEPALLQAWQSGKTGIALVDAGMAELWEAGWMHNRVRMVVASFLTKNLGQHWHHGARWFWDTLVDADLASNTLGWQWVAGCGADAAPYYRIFNPDIQAEKFDPQAIYRSCWIGNRGNVPPITHLASSRRAALDRYREKIG